MLSARLQSLILMALPLSLAVATHFDSIAASKLGQLSRQQLTNWPESRHYGRRGAIAQLVARLNGIEKVSGSNPLSSIELIQFEAAVDAWIFKISEFQLLESR